MFHAQFPGLRAYKSALCSNGCTIQIPPDSCAAIRAAFTFHYGSTYTKLHRQLHEHHILFTFHYGSTYNRRKAGTWQDLKIYIPLWFYLYRLCLALYDIYYSFTFHYGSTYTGSSHVISYRDIHLHSTMVLLIPRSRRDLKFSLRIYIPLWFYLYPPE